VRGWGVGDAICCNAGRKKKKMGDGIGRVALPVIN